LFVFRANLPIFLLQIVWDVKIWFYEIVEVFFLRFFSSVAHFHFRWHDETSSPKILWVEGRGYALRPLLASEQEERRIEEEFA
jgi:hypothetical protein